MSVKKCFIFVVLVTETIFYSIGFLLGWKYFVPMLTDRRYFSDSCDPDEDVCSTQLEMLDAVYLVSIQSMFICALVGWMMDKTGVVFTRKINVLATTTGFILLLASHFNLPNALFAAIPLLCIAGYGTFLVNISTAYTTISSNLLVVGVICGAFTSSRLSLFITNALFFTTKCNIAWIAALYVVFYYLLQIFLQLLTRESGRSQPPIEVLIEEEMTVGTFGEREAEKKSFDFTQIGLWTNGLRFGIVQFALLMYSDSYSKISSDSPEESPNQFVYNYGAFFGVLYGAFAGYTVDKVLNKLQQPEVRFGGVLVILDMHVFMMPLYHQMYYPPIPTIFLFVEDIIRVYLFTTTIAYLLIYFPVKRFGILFGSTVSIGGLFFLLQEPIRALREKVDDEYAVCFIMMAIFFLSNLHCFYLTWQAKKLGGSKSNKKRRNLYPDCLECNN